MVLCGALKLLDINICQLVKGKVMDLKIGSNSKMHTSHNSTHLEHRCEINNVHTENRFGHFVLHAAF